MKISKILCCSVLAFITIGLSAKDNKKEAGEVIKRALGKQEIPVKLSIDEAEEAYFDYEVKKGVLSIKASDNVALCRGFYDFMKRHGYGMFTWSGSSLKLPEFLPETPAYRVESPVPNHYYFNVCTFGYSMPYWDWSRWEREIDWMALHGVNMPLALVAYEAIITRVWKQMGLTDEEVNAYFTAPAHLPWMRMGNVCGIDSPLDENWHSSQIALQHKILKRMRDLGMKPICPGFPGFIPEAFKRVYPNVNIIKTSWGGAFHNWMISPQEKLFSDISTAFIREWEKEFGRCDYYLVDSFNEMDIPFPEHGTKERYDLVASYGEKVYEGIRRANPKATWVMQGWMFGYQRNIWDYKTLEALVSKVPDDKMLLLDLAVDYNKKFWNSEVNWEFYKGFYNKQWIYSVIPNMGGKTGLTGFLDFYANGHLEALQSGNRGNLVGIGAAPEGIENNEILYEMIMDAAWKDSKTNVREWVDNYLWNRYGKRSAKMIQAWEYLNKSAYNYFTDHPRYNWQFRPGTVQNGSIAITDDFLKGLEFFIEASDVLGDNKYYRMDLAEMTAHYLGAKSEILIRLIDQDYLLGDTVSARFQRSRLETLMLGMDALLGTHPYLRLDRWVDFAKNAAVGEKQKEQFAINAKRIVTIWGPPVDDYSARIWSGLVKDYYLPRWKHYYDSRDSGKTFDFASWECNWVENPVCSLSVGTALDDVVGFAKLMLSLSKDITWSNLKIKSTNPTLGYWQVTAGKEQVLSYTISSQYLQKYKIFALKQLKGNSPASVLRYEVIADGKVVLSASDVQLKDGLTLCNIEGIHNVQANNECIFKVYLKAGGSLSSGMIFALKD